MSMWLRLAVVHVWAAGERQRRDAKDPFVMKRLSAMNTIENKNVNHIYIRHAKAILAKFEVGAKPRARDPPATPRRERWRRRRSRVYLHGRGWGTRACGYEKG